MYKITETLPLKELNNLSVGEKLHKQHPGNLHLWWNRSPIKVSEELLQYSIGVKQNNNGPTIIDPFSGSGCLAVAAAKESPNTIAGDLNSVAVVITKTAAEIPGMLQDVQPVNGESKKNIYSGTEGLAEDVRYYGEIIKKKLIRKLRKVYPTVKLSLKTDCETQSYVWVRNVECPNPACKCRVPLASSFSLVKQGKQQYWAEPVKKGYFTEFTVHAGECPKENESNKIGTNGAKFKCPFCGEVINDTYVKEAGLEKRIGMQLMAVGIDVEGGRQFCTPDKEQVFASEIKTDAELPPGELPNNTRWFSPPGFGYRSYTDLFTNRQLLLLTTLSDLIIATQKIIYKDAKKSGMIDDKVPLNKGGTGALAYSQAISVYLTLVLSKLINYQSSICTLDNRKGNLRATFTRQAIPMTWVFVEGNPFSEVTGNYNSILNGIVEAVKELPCKNAAEVIQCDAIRMEYPQNSVLFTELPYYDNVGYADLSDYFYIWMRRSLKGIYPELFTRIVTSKEELSSIPEHFDGNSEKGRKAYEESLRELLKQFSKNASTDYSSMLFFKYSKDDDSRMLSNKEQPGFGSLENLIDAIIQNGFKIQRIWPIRTEPPNEKYDTIRICIVFKKNPDCLPKITRRGFVTELKKLAPKELETAYSGGVADYDMTIVGVGACLSLLTEYKSVLNADGSTMSIHDALQIIRNEVDEYIDNYNSANEEG